MKRILYITVALFCLAAAASCVEEDLDACPPDGGKVAITLRAEKFQARPPYAPDELEANFAARIRSLDYLLYAEGELIEQGRLADAPATSGNGYVFRHDALPFGSYRAVFAANVSPRIMTGRAESPENYFITYRGEKEGDDHFRADLPFEVTCPCSNEFETVLRRVYGVARFRFENLPAEIDAVEVSLDNVGERIPLCGDPNKSCVVAKRVSAADLAARSTGTVTLGTFPTLPGAKTSWRLKLYGRENDAPVYDQLVTDTLHIESNQLVELTARFRNSGDIEFRVDMDTTWDGSNEGGGGEITISEARH